MKNDKKSGTQLVERTETSQQYTVDIAKSKDEHESKSKKVLQKSGTSCRSTLDAMLEECQIIGFDWRYRYLNDAVVTHGHHTKEELLGHTMMEVYPGIENTEMFAELRGCMEKRTSYRMENEFTFPDGSKGWFDLSMEPVPEGILVLSRDITERKRAEEALRVGGEIPDCLGGREGRLLGDRPGWQFHFFQRCNMPPAGVLQKRDDGDELSGQYGC